jgi:hypothetical protein
MLKCFPLNLVPQDLVYPIVQYLPTPDVIQLFQTSKQHRERWYPRSGTLYSFPRLLGRGGTVHVNRWEKVLWYACQIKDDQELVQFILDWERTVYSARFVLEQQLIRILQLPCTLSVLDRSPVKYRDSPQLARLLGTRIPPMRWLELGFVHAFYTVMALRPTNELSFIQVHTFLWSAVRRSRDIPIHELVSEQVCSQLFLDWNHCRNPELDHPSLIRRVPKDGLSKYMIPYLPLCTEISVLLPPGVVVMHALMGNLNDGIDSAELVDERVDVESNYDTRRDSVLPWIRYYCCIMVDSSVVPFNKVRRERLVRVIERIKQRLQIRSFNTASLLEMMDRLKHGNDPQVIVEFWLHGLERSKWYELCGQPYTRSCEQQEVFPSCRKNSTLWKVMSRTAEDSSVYPPRIATWCAWMMLSRATGVIPHEWLAHLYNQWYKVVSLYDIQYVLMCLGAKVPTESRTRSSDLDIYYPALSQRVALSMTHLVMTVPCSDLNPYGLRNDSALFRVLKRMVKMDQHLDKEWERVMSFGLTPPVCGGTGHRRNGRLIVDTRNDPGRDAYYAYLAESGQEVFWARAIRLAKYMGAVIPLHTLFHKESHRTFHPYLPRLDDQVFEVVVQNIPPDYMRRYANNETVSACNLPYRTLTALNARMINMPAVTDWKWGLSFQYPTHDAVSCDQTIPPLSPMKDWLTNSGVMIWTTVSRSQLSESVAPVFVNEVYRNTETLIWGLVGTCHWDMIRWLLASDIEYSGTRQWKAVVSGVVKKMVDEERGFRFPLDVLESCGISQPTESVDMST